ncbi:MAG: hypothetical protein LWX11_10470, partial [Firmicutes bacterium]|nr:hypothetical protein [Bacillota bacterium]
CLGLSLGLWGQGPVTGQSRKTLDVLLTEGPLSQAEACLPKTTDGERFALGVAQTLRALERLGQGLHRYGIQDHSVPLMRLPVPLNEAAKPIRYQDFRGIFQQLVKDLAQAERTLATVQASDFKVPMALGRVKLDLDGDGVASDRLLDLVRELRGNLPPEVDNDLVVAFDAGDAAWLRGYTHLLMALADFYLAFDTRAFWNEFAPHLFAHPVLEPESVTPKKGDFVLRLADPKALGRFRQHLLAMGQQSRLSWQRIQAETDDDREWLPSPRQTGVLGVPVSRDMIEAWLDMIGELEKLLEGRTVISLKSQGDEVQRGFDLKKFLEHPPSAVNLDRWFRKGPDAAYFRTAPAADSRKLNRALQVFAGNFMGMALWFN